MGFLFPLFLLAGLALIIPVLIHLFNLRRYKKTYFPDTRFLRNIQLSTKRQAKIRNWKLLIVRMLFLAALILAFAQPYLGGNSNKDNRVGITVIYIDNSYSMTVAEGASSRLQQVKNKAQQLIASMGNDARFLLLTNDKTAAMRPMAKEEALQMTEQIVPIAKTASLKQVIGSIQAAQENEKNEHWQVYIFSDLQKETFIPKEDRLPGLTNTTLYFYPVNEGEVSNLYIDTAYFLLPALDSRQANPLVVKVKHSGNNHSGKPSNLHVAVNGQVRAVSTIELEKDTQWTDTLMLQLSGGDWQQISIALEDHPLSFDDTFRIAARATPQLSVLVVTDQAISPYLQAAFRTYEGFRAKVESPATIKKSEWQTYSLIVLQNINNITSELQIAVREALDRGQNILLFPGSNIHTDAFNQSLRTWGDISLDKADTAIQQVVTLQQAHPLLQDMFEKVPDNIQLPVTSKRYPVQASLTAGQQLLMGFRDGKPFLAQYNLGQGKLYLCASPLDDKATNFPVSYFFVPVLYKMAVQSGGNSVYAVSIGSRMPLWLPSSGADRRNVWHLVAPGFEAVPQQRPSGAGTEIFAGSVAQNAGFYSLYRKDIPDSITIALNADRAESVLEYAGKQDIERLIGQTNVQWIDDIYIREKGWSTARASFPIWKICILIALACLAVETYFLLKKR